MAERVIFHVDVNSAFLSWTAAYRCRVLGQSLDLRQVPAVVASQADVRRSIVLAKSAPAKACGIRTGEPLGMARDKCPGLLVAEPDYALYLAASRSLMELLRTVSPVVEQYSIDEAWVDMTGTERLYGPPVLAGRWLADRIFRELGFTVSIGISSNKILAKMAGELKKPNGVSTVFPWEMAEKLWPLPVRELFFVGPATEKKLRRMGIATIGQLAQAEPELLRQKLHQHGENIWHLANGRCAEPVQTELPAQKGYGNSMTTPWDVTDLAGAQQVLLSLCETVAARMRRDGQRGREVAVQFRTSQFAGSAMQRQMASATHVTAEIYEAACAVLEQLWDQRTPLRQLGVQVGKVSWEPYRQYSLFDKPRVDRLEKLDAAVDTIRAKFGEEAVCRASVLHFENSRKGAQTVAFGVHL